MSFLNPWLLFGTLGVSLPIIAHMLNRYQVKQTDWAAMQFLNRSVRVRSRQLRLRDLLLLLLRCLAILFMVFAISKPAMKSAGNLASKFGERRAGVIIALDASFSMQHSDGTTTRFERALEKIGTIAEDIHPGAPVSLILLGDQHRVVARNMAYNQERFGDILQAQRATSEQLKMETVPAELSRLASEMEAIQKEIYVVTDLQSKDWQDPSPRLRDALRELNKLANTMIVPVQGTPENLAITDFELFSGVLRKGTTAQYSATVHNYGMTPVNNVRVKCLMEGVNVDSKTIPSIGGRSSQTVSFFVPFHNSGSVKLSAQLPDDALILDNTRRTVANIRERVSILCVEGKSYGNSLESFIAKALRTRGVASSKENFKVRSVSWLSLPSQDLNKFDIVILSDVPEITSQQADQLKEYVKKGNGLIWFGGENLKVAEWNKCSARNGDSLLPAIIGEIVKVSDEMGVGRPLDPLLPEHPVCRPLRSLPNDLLSETQFQRLLDVKPLPASSVVLNLSGSISSVLIEQSIGRGHVFMFTTSANPTWNNMALTPVFPMLMQQMVTYLTGREFEKSRLVGSSLSLSYPDRPDANDGVFETPSDEIIKVPVRQHGNQYVAFLEHAHESGFYIARVSVQSPGMPIAVNVDTHESDVRCLDPAEAQSTFAESGIVVAQSTTDFIEDVRTGYEYWRLLMAAALAALILESLLASNIFKRKKSKLGSPLQNLGQSRGAIK